jgi:threonine dehydrogenase-like Zn-dependent dehydrogenase
VVGIDPLSQRCALAERMGATRTLNQRAAEVARSRRLSGLEGLEPEICIEAVGHQTETLNDCIELIRYQGEILAFGVPDQTVYDLEFEAFFRKNARMLAVVTPPWTDYLAKARDLFLAHRDELSALVTHRLPIHQAQQAFSLYERHEAGIVKVILHAPFDSQDSGA